MFTANRQRGQFLYRGKLCRHNFFRAWGGKTAKIAKIAGFFYLLYLAKASIKSLFAKFMWNPVQFLHCTLMAAILKEILGPTIAWNFRVCQFVSTTKETKKSIVSTFPTYFGNGTWLAIATCPTHYIFFFGVSPHLFCILLRNPHRTPLLEAVYLAESAFALASRVPWGGRDTLFGVSNLGELLTTKL